MQHKTMAILGFGTVGTGVYRIATENRTDFMHREDIDLEVVSILEKYIDRAVERKLAPKELFTDDYEQVLSKKPDVIVECMGGIEPARTFILKALQQGISVVTSNKEVISKHWPEFDAMSKESGAGLYIEATVGGGIPLLRTITDSLQANNITKVMGIINGTTNYILTKMTGEGKEFAEVLKEAQSLGYAEANPTADVDGYDATYKLSILSSLAFHSHIPVDVIYREGISNLTRADIRMADQLGYEIKLLAIGKKEGNAIEVRVHPTLIPKDHPLAAVRGVFNAVYITGHAVDDVMLYGRGAGCMPTASAIMGDVLFALRMGNRHYHISFRNEAALSEEVDLVRNFRSIYCVRVLAGDRPGTMAEISGVFARHDVSLKSVLQLDRRESGFASITFMTHEAYENSLRDAIGEIEKLPCVERVESIIRAEA